MLLCMILIFLAQKRPHTMRDRASIKFAVSSRPLGSVNNAWRIVFATKRYDFHSSKACIVIVSTWSSASIAARLVGCRGCMCLKVPIAAAKLILMTRPRTFLRSRSSGKSACEGMHFLLPLRRIRDAPQSARKAGYRYSPVILCATVDVWEPRRKA